MSRDLREWKTHGASVAFYVLLLAVCMIPGAAAAEAPDPAAYWSFDRREGAEVADRASGRVDKIKGRFKRVPGVAGKALRLDGCTTELVRPAEAGPKADGSVTVEGRVAVAAYPWNWCPGELTTWRELSH